MCIDTLQIINLGALYSTTTTTRTGRLKTYQFSVTIITHITHITICGLIGERKTINHMIGQKSFVYQ